ncbi:hypothetical protein BraRD5C2_71980 [Bradyrhizobium sp. RD5-C2]|nr:hypothetical protein BraRD5C2_71980 [Bradyrhizobium sp. RD5-C2]
MKRWSRVWLVNQLTTSPSDCDGTESMLGAFMAGSGAAGGVGNRYVVLPPGHVNAASGIVIELVGLPEPLEGHRGPPRGVVTARA